MEPQDVKQLLATPGGLRAAMPETAAFIDAMREAFGKGVIDAVIKAGLRGEPRFWASESGITIGTRVFRDVGKG